MKKFILFLVIFGALGYGVWNRVVAAQYPDTDGDKINDFNEEVVYHTEKFNPDTDGDGYPDGIEISKEYSPSYGNKIKLEDVDSDRDGLSDAKEIKADTDLLNPDTDGDGFSDFLEIQNGSDPLDGKKVERSSFNFLRKLK
jgi:hypothetical protein